MGSYTDDLFSQDQRGTRQATPVGLQQQTSVRDPFQQETLLDGNPNRSFQESLFAQDSRGNDPRWQTGGRLGSIENGWNTQFFEKMFGQVDRSINDGSFLNLYRNKDYTGVVTWEGNKDASGRAVKFGDVYENGQAVGNLYDPDSGYDKSTADLLMGELTLDSKTRQNTRDPEILAQEVQRQRGITESENKKGLSALAYQGEVEDTKKDFSQQKWIDPATVAGGAVGGAAVGAGIGAFFGGVGAIPGAIIGGIAGGAGAFLNRDELKDQAARTAVQAAMQRREENEFAAVTTELFGAGGLAMKALMPLNNLTRGLYEVSVDGVGDSVVDWYAVDQVTGDRLLPWGWDVANYASMIVDGVGTFSTAPGRVLFQATMGMTIGGQVGQIVATGGETFNDRSGQFESVFVDADGNFDLLSSAAGVANVGINVVQMGGVAGLFRAAKDSVKVAAGLPAAGSRTLTQRLLGRQADGLTRVSVGGWRYTVNEGGQAVGKRTMSLGILAPSEFLPGVTASMLARTAAARTGAGGKITADDYYQNAQSLLSGQRPWTTVLVTGIGEGYEEALQSVLEPVSHREQIDWDDVRESTLSGAAMGVGMGVGAVRTGATQIERTLAIVNSQRSAGQRIPLDRWKSMTQSDRQREGMRSKADFELQRVSNENLTAEQRASLAVTHPAIERRIADSALQAAIKDTTNAVGKTDASIRITLTQDAAIPGNAAVASMGRVIRMLGAQATGLFEGANTEQDPALAAGLEAAAYSAQTLVQNLQQFQRAFDNAGTQLERTELVEQFNSLIERWFTGDPTLTTPDPVTGKAPVLSDEERKTRMRAATIIIGRYPIDQKGSYQAVLPQADRQLSEAKADNVVQIGHAVLKPLGADFDGDRISQKARLVMDENKFAAERAGRNRVTPEGKVALNQLDWEGIQLTMLGDVMSLPKGDARRGVAQLAVTRIKSRLQQRFGSLPGFVGHLDKFLLALKNGDTASPVDFRDTLAKELGAELGEYGMSEWVDPWIFIDDVVQQELQSMQQRLAGRASSKKLVDTKTAPEAPTSDAYRIRQERAATEGSSLLQASNGTVMSRIVQALQYSVKRVQTFVGKVPTGDPLAAATDLYILLSEEMTEDALSAVNAREGVLGRVIVGLRAMSRELNIPLAILANSALMDITEGQAYQGERASALQLLLRHEVAVERRSYSEIGLDNVPEVKARLAALDSLTRTAKEVRGGNKRKSSTNAGAAFLEVFGETPLYDLLGEDALTLGINLTVRQHYFQYLNLGTRQRAREKQAMQRSGAYAGRKQKNTNVPYGLDEAEAREISAYRSVVDSILDAANHDIWMEDSGVNAGKPRGEIARQSGRVGKKLRKAVTMVQDALTEAGLPRTIEGVQELMATTVEFAEGVAGMIQLDVGQAFARLEFDEKTQTIQYFMSPWLLEAFTRPPAEAEMMMLRNLILLGYNAAGGRVDEDGDAGAHGREYDRLVDRMHRTFYRLQREGDGGLQLARLQVLMNTAQSVEDFEAEFNRDFLTANEAPFVAWVRDRTRFEGGSLSTGWTTQVYGAEEREAIQELHDAAAIAVRTVRERLKADEAEIQLGMHLKQARDAERDGPRDPITGEPSDAGRASSVALEGLRRAISFARINQSVLGPGLVELLAVTAAEGFVTSGANKGKSAVEYAGLGQRDSQGDTFGTPFVQSSASLGTRDLDSVARNLGLTLKDGVVTMDYDGVPMEFDQNIEDYLIDNWDRPEVRRFIRRALVPSVTESVANGRGTQEQSLVEENLADLLTGRIHQHLFDEGQEAILLSYVDGLAHGPDSRSPMAFLLGQLMVARTSVLQQPVSGVTGQDTSLRAMFATLRNTVARLITEVGDLASQTTTARDQSGNEIRVPLMGEDPVTKELRPVLEILRNAVKETLLEQAEKRRLGAGHVALPPGYADIVKATLQEAELQLLDPQVRADPEHYNKVAARVKVLRSTQRRSPLDDALLAFSYDPTGPTDMGRRRREEFQRIITMSPYLADKAPWARRAIQKLLNDSGAMILDSDGIPRLTPTEWNLVSRALMADYLERWSGVPASNNVKLPVFPDYTDAAQKQELKYWDPTWASLVDDIFAESFGIVEAAAGTFKMSHKAHSASQTSLLALITQSFGDNSNLFGEWTADMPALMEHNARSLRISGAGMMIGAAGIVPEQQAILEAATRRDHTHPDVMGDPTLLSASTLPARVLLQGDPRLLQVPVLHGNQTESRVPLLAFNGRFAHTITLKVAGQQDQVLLSPDVDDPRVSRLWADDPVEPNPWLQVTDLASLRNAVKAAVDAGASIDDIAIDIQFLHPDRQPAGMMHNVYFEGLAGALPSNDNAESLVATLITETEGENRRYQHQTLKAGKTRTFSILMAKTFSLVQKRRLETGWEIDLSSVLKRKTLAMLRIPVGNRRMLESDYNAVLKHWKMRHFVRGINLETGEAELWHAEKVLAWQQANPGARLDSVLSQAELYIPSEPILRALYGDVFVDGASVAITEVPRQDFTQVPIFTGELNALTRSRIRGALQVDPKTGKWVKRDFAEAVSSLLRVRPRHSRGGAAINKETESDRGVRIRRRDVQRADIHDARKESWNKHDFSTAKDRFALALASSNTAGKAAISWRAITGVALPGDQTLEALLDEQSRTRLAEFERTATYGAAWVLDDESRDVDPYLGVINTAVLGSPPSRAMAVAPGDPVMVNVDAYANDLEKGGRALQLLINAGARIGLASPNNNRTALAYAARYIEESGTYAPFSPGSRVAFEEVTTDTPFANQNAQGRASSVHAARPLSQENLVFILRDKNARLGENAVALWREDPTDNDGEVLVEMDLMPTLPYQNFAPPRSPAQIDMVQRTIIELSDSTAGLAFLRKQAGVKANTTDGKAFDAALQQLLDGWKTSTTSSTIVSPSDWGAGSIIPLLGTDQDGNASIILYRQGHQWIAPGVKLEAELERPVQKGGEPARVAVYGPKIDPAATVHNGRLERSVMVPGKGLMAKLWVDLRKLGAKVQLELSGMKYTIGTAVSAMPKPSFGFMTNRDFDLYADQTSGDDKDANSLVLGNHQVAFAVFGINFEEPLVEFFTGATKSSANYAAMVTRTNNILQFLSEKMPTQGERVLRQIQDTGTIDPVVLAELKGIVTNAPDGAPSMLDRINDQGTDRAAAVAGVARGMMLFLLSRGSAAYGAPNYRQVMRTGGMNTPGGRSSGLLSQLMSPVFTEYFDSLSINHPTRVLINKMLNAQTGKNGDEGYIINPNFSISLQVRNEAGEMEVYHDLELQIAEAHTSGDNPARDAQLESQGNRQNITVSDQRMASLAFGGRVAGETSQRRTRALVERTGVTRFEEGATVWDLLQDIPTEERVPTMFDLDPASQLYEEVSSDVADHFRQALEFEYWEKLYNGADLDKKMEQFETSLSDLAKTLGLTAEQRVVLHGFIRQYLGTPKLDPTAPNYQELQDTGVGQVSFEDAMDALAHIRFNISNGYLPTVDMSVPQIHYNDLAALYEGWRKTGGWNLRSSMTDDTGVEDWRGWVQVALAFGETKGYVFDGMYLTATDGMLQSYRYKERSLLGLPVSRNDLRLAKLFDPETSRYVVSIDPLRNSTMSESVQLDAAYTEYSNLFGVVRQGGAWHAKMPANSAIARRRKAAKRWREQNNIPFSVQKSLKDFRSQGAEWEKEAIATNLLSRVLIDLRHGTSTLNPLLWVSSGFEMGIRVVLENMTNVVSGGTLGGGLVGIGSQYTSEQQEIFAGTIRTLGALPEFKNMMFRDMLFQRDKGGASLLETGTRTFAKWGSLLQDPSRWLRGDVMARLYMTSVLSYTQTHPGIKISPEKLASNLRGDVRWVEKNILDAHNAGVNVISDMRSIKQTMISTMLRQLYEPLSNNPRHGAQMLGLALRLPLLYSNYFGNITTTLTGMNGANELAATLLAGRANPLGGLRSWVAGDGWKEGADARFETDSMLEGLDLSKAFIKGAVTHTTVFTLAMLAGGVGLGLGGDEEERRRRRAMMYQGGGIVYDPRDIINDVRNADALYLDWLGPLAGLFPIPDPSDMNSSSSMANPHWMMRQFVSPILGIERFIQSGDVRHIGWGFADAVGSFPLINTAMWNDTNDMVARLMGTLPDDLENSDDVETALEAFGTLIRIVATYEQMLFESSFINMLYVGMDDYDRNPWHIPKQLPDGSIFRDDLGVPMRTDALNDFVDPETGEVRQGFENYDWWNATLRGFTENRHTLALLMGMFDGTYRRENMVAKTYKIEKEQLTQEQARSLALGLFDQVGGGDAMRDADGNESYIMSEVDQSGNEVLTLEGAAAVLQGVWMKSVQPGSPSLNGVFITKEDRDIIARDVMSELIQEGIDMGLSDYDARGRMLQVFWGPREDPTVVGLGDILYNKDIIPYVQSEQYYQLNTTYMIGPDGRPIVTGLARTNLHQAFGFAPLNRYYTGDVGGLGVDGRLNSTDQTIGVNTGIRGLRKVPTSDGPSPEEIRDMKSAIVDEIMGGSNEYSPNRPNYGTSGYGYSRGGGGGYSFRTNSVGRNNPTYARNIPYVRMNDPLIRRAQVRRERFSSTRGRLNQWQ